MKRIIHALTLLIVFTLFTSNSFAQSKFDQGFNDGYKQGFCHEKVNCIPPIPPIAPIPTVSEDLDSHQDGYNRGFKMGLEAQKGNTSESSQSGYKTASAKPIDYMYNPNNPKIQQAIAKNRNFIFDKIIKEAEGYYDNTEYARCIKACNDAMEINNLVSKECYTLIAKSYAGLGKIGKAKRYLKKADKLN
jgi:hypothetical protein